MKFTVTAAALQINVLALTADDALSAARDALSLSYSEVFYAEVTDGFTDGVRVVNAIS